MLTNRRSARRAGPSRGRRHRPGNLNAAVARRSRHRLDARTRRSDRGTLEATACPEGGRVHAKLPLNPATSSRLPCRNGQPEGRRPHECRRVVGTKPRYTSLDDDIMSVALGVPLALGWVHRRLHHRPAGRVRGTRLGLVRGLPGVTDRRVRRVLPAATPGPGPPVCGCRAVGLGEGEGGRRGPRRAPPAVVQPAWTRVCSWIWRWASCRIRIVARVSLLVML